MFFIFFVPSAAMSNPPDLYYLISSPPCRAVLLLIRTLQMKVNLIEVNILEGEQFRPQYLRMNPQHTIPVLDDNGLVLTDSHAILCYLVEMYGTDDRLYPKDVKKRALINQKLYFDMELFSRFLNYAPEHIKKKVPAVGYTTYEHYVKRKKMPMIFEKTEPDQDRHNRVEESIGFLDRFLEGHSWVAGEDISIADFALSTTMSNIDIFSLDLSFYPNIHTWFSKVKMVLPGYKEINEPGLDILKKFIPLRK